MKRGWRSYGDSDSTTLKEVRLASITGVIAAFYGRKPGEVCTVNNYGGRRTGLAELHGLEIGLKYARKGL